MNKQERGFAVMGKERVKEIATKGGEARREQLGSEGYSEMGQVVLKDRLCLKNNCELNLLNQLWGKL